MSTIIEELLKLQDMEYRIFMGKLLSSVEPESILGITGRQS